MSFKRTNQEKIIFLFLRFQRVLFYTVLKDFDLCLFLNKNVKRWKFSKSKVNIGRDDERTITVTFITNLHGTILPMQLISGGKTVQSLNKFAFPEAVPGKYTKIIK